MHLDNSIKNYIENICPCIWFLEKGGAILTMFSMFCVSALLTATVKVDFLLSVQYHLCYSYSLDPKGM